MKEYYWVNICGNLKVAIKIIYQDYGIEWIIPDSNLKIEIDEIDLVCKINAPEYYWVNIHDNLIMATKIIHQDDSSEWFIHGSKLDFEINDNLVVCKINPPSHIIASSCV